MNTTPKSRKSPNPSPTSDAAVYVPTWFQPEWVRLRDGQRPAPRRRREHGRCVVVGCRLEAISERRYCRDHDD